MSENAQSVQVGDEVYGSDGDKLGRVVSANADYLVVEKGWFFPTDYYIPVAAVHGVDAGKIYLNVTKDAALDQGWDVEPTISETVAPLETTATTGLSTASSGARTTALTDSDTLTVPVYEEELTATKTAREVGGARIEKSVVAEEQTLEVPVTEEHLKVVRRVVDRPVDAAAVAFEEGVIDVPVTVEEVDLETRTRVAEEIVIEKEAVQRTERVAGTVRREHVEVVEADADAIVDENDATPRPR